MILKDFPLPVRRITPYDAHYFYGYYDNPGIDPTDRYQLAHKVSFMDRMPTKNDWAELGIIDMHTNEFTPIAKTQAWNFQQGAMFQYLHGTDAKDVIYNDFIDGEYVAVIMNLATGKTRYLDRPVANIAPNGKYALSINFSRLFDFRPGYGYCNIPDKFYYKNHSADDGVFLTDISTGKSKLIISYEQLWEFTNSYFKGVDQKIIVNHITFNTDSSRFIMLLRNFVPAGSSHITALVTADTSGENMYLLSDYGVQSHYHWKDKENIIFFSNGKELECSAGWANNYVLKDKTHDGYLVADGFFSNRDNHMSYSPNRKYFITDTYPSASRMQSLRLYDIEKNICYDLGKFYSVNTGNVDSRCDMHPRWNCDGTAITFDSTHEGFRGIYRMELTDIL